MQPAVLRWYCQKVMFPWVTRWSLLVLLGGFTVLGLMRGFQLIERASFDFKPPANSKAELAEQMLTRYFPQVAGEAAATTVLIQSLRGKDVTVDPQVRAFESAFEQLLRYDFSDVLVFESFSKLKRNGLEYFANQLINNVSGPTAQTIRLGLSRLPSPDFTSKDFADMIDDAIKLLAYNEHLPKSDYFVASTGAAVFSRDVRVSTERDVSFIDGATFPIAMVTLAVVLRSFRLLLLPVICIVSVISISLLVMLELSEKDWVKITTLVPSIMMSSSVGFSIDYSLFLLSRFREEIRNERSVQDAVLQSVCYAGHTVVVSGLTLAFCWFVLMSFPVSIVSSVGIAAGLTTTICVLVNLTLTPCLILTFPVFFSTESSFFSLQDMAKLRKRWVQRVTRLVRWLLCSCPFCRCKRTRQEIATRDESRLDSPLLMDDENPLLPSQTCQPTLRINAPVSSSSAALMTQHTMDPSVNDSPEPSDSSSSIVTGMDDLPTRPTATASQEEVAVDEPPSRPPSRTPIIFIENNEQVATEMRFVEENAKRTFKVARFVTSSNRVACFIVTLLTAFLVPFGYFAWHYDHSDSFLLMIPRTAQGTKAYRVMEVEFGHGRLDPYQVVIVPPNVGEPSLLNPTISDVSRMRDVFDFAQSNVIRGVLLNDTLPTIANIQSVAWLFDRPISFDEYRRCSLLKATRFCRAILVAAARGLSKEGALLMRVELTVEPSSEKGQAWLRRTRRALDLLMKENAKYEVHIAQGASVSLDVVASVYEQFPMAIAFTATVVLVLVAFAFQSIIVPLRALFSIAATLCFVYGSAVLVYQHGLLKWTNIKGLQSPTDEIFWVSPIMLFGVLCGISLDYDTFTLTRIVEYRTAGFSDTDSVRAGLASSFKVVTTAGFIMTIAFCGLLFSDLPVLNQISFFLCTAILFDTFIVRMFYVPSMMILLGRFNWFPRNSLAKFETQS